VLQANSADTLVNHIRWVSTAVLKAASAPASRVIGAAATGNVPLPVPPPGALGSAADVW
jgi:hypothetical protein